MAVVGLPLLVSLLAVLIHYQCVFAAFIVSHLSGEHVAEGELFIPFQALLSSNSQTFVLLEALFSQ